MRVRSTHLKILAFPYDFQLVTNKYILTRFQYYCRSTEPTMSPTKAPTRTPTASPSSHPSSKPSSSPTTKPSSHDSSRPSNHPTGPSMCVDDINYVSPIDESAGCELYEAVNGECDCSVWFPLLNPAELQDLYRSCPITCDLPCDTAIPSASPSEDIGCADDPNYLNPIISVGCSYHAAANLSCSGWSVLMDNAQHQDLLLRCPLACGLCG